MFLGAADAPSPGSTQGTTGPSRADSCCTLTVQVACYLLRTLGWNNGPQTLSTGWIHYSQYITLNGEKRLCRCNWFKDLKMTGYPRLSGWTLCNHKHISKWKARGWKGGKKETRQQKQRLKRCALKWRKRPQATESLGNVGGGKGEETFFHLAVPLYSLLHPLE